MKVKDKVAIVTGASSGIGLATAKLLTKKGAKVALVARSKDKLKKIQSELQGSLAVVCDMSKEKDIKKMVKTVTEHFGRIDILINNAGQGYDSPVEKIDSKTYHHIFDLDVVGPVIAMQNVIPFMRKQGGGAIVNISSGTALMALENMAGYSSLKRALAGISLTAREELKKDNIQVCVVYPYVTLTDFEKNTIRANKVEYDEDWLKNLPNPPDSAGHVAKIIIEGIEKNTGEIFAHDWMKNLKS